MSTISDWLEAIGGDNSALLGDLAALREQLARVTAENTELREELQTLSNGAPPLLAELREGVERAKAKVHRVTAERDEALGLLRDALEAFDQAHMAGALRGAIRAALAQHTEVSDA